MGLFSGGHFLRRHRRCGVALHGVSMFWCEFPSQYCVPHASHRTPTDLISHKSEYSHIKSNIQLPCICPVYKSRDLRWSRNVVGNTMMRYIGANCGKSEHLEIGEWRLLEHIRDFRELENILQYCGMLEKIEENTVLNILAHHVYRVRYSIAHNDRRRSEITGEPWGNCG